MKVRYPAILFLFLFASSLTLPSATAGASHSSAQSGDLQQAAPLRANIQVVSDKVTITFPETILFEAEFQSSVKIDSAVLEYGVNQLTCGTVQAQAFPTFTAGTDVKVQWTWEMRESGSLPPGANVWWQWALTDSSGSQFTSPKQSTIWLDSTNAWQTITGGQINLHYYNEPADFGNQLHDAAVAALVRLRKDIGLSTDQPVDIYIYYTYQDLQNAVLFAPSWAGGQAFPENNIVIIGVPSNLIDYGKSSEAHELTHVLVGHLTFSCLNFIPQWLNEGLATYGEGGPQADAQALFDKAKSNNQMPSLRSLIGQFSAEQNRALLSYAEAYSVVNFMAKTYGQQKMLALLTGLHDGQSMDQALQSVYGFNMDGLENAWRASIGMPASAGNETPTPNATPTAVPTIVPIGAIPIAQGPGPTPQPTVNQPAATQGGISQAPSATPGANGNSNPSQGPRNTALILGSVAACLVLLVIVGVIIVFLVIRRPNRRPQ